MNVCMKHKEKEKKNKKKHLCKKLTMWLACESSEFWYH